VLLAKKSKPLKLGSMQHPLKDHDRISRHSKNQQQYFCCQGDSYSNSTSAMPLVRDASP